MESGPRLPDPALVVLVGASGAGKSTWATARFRATEIVSADELRGVVGSGRHDLDASTDAFDLLDLIVEGRLRRGLTTVVDTLGLDTDRRRGYLSAARRHGMPAAVVHVDTPAAVCRRRNAGRDRPVPAPALARQLASAREVGGLLDDEGWDVVARVDERDPPTPAPAPAAEARPDARAGLDVVLQVSRFPWGEDPTTWLRDVALAAEAAGLAGIALMDHLMQIPQVDSVWQPIPEPWVTLGLLAGLDTRLRLGTLVTPVTFRPPGVTAKAAATLDVLSGGRAFLGVGAGWWEREHLGFAVPFPSRTQRLDDLEAGIETMRALWSPGTKRYVGRRASLPETTSYPRPVHDISVIVGGGGERRTLRIAARLGDACNIGSDLDTVDRKTAVLRRHCEEVGRAPEEVAVTVLDLPVVGDDREDAWRRVERLRGRTAAASYATKHHAGTVAQHRERYAELAERGVSTVFVAPAGLEGADDVLRLSGVTP
jgi:alkanesulfonate monooxygenase SsuD/methylene tetrahydromethanopterin reductase-like flavin-dependent oxidoreductase (luciferase family)/predicted kinase